MTGSGAKRGEYSRAAMQHVRHRILAGELRAGATLRPEDVGKELGISPTPAREALQALRVEGFIQSKPGVGFVVAPLTPDDLLDVYTTHSLIAGELAARACSRATPADVDELEALHFELLAASRRQRHSDAEAANHRFHRLIAHLAASPKMADILGLVSRYIPRSFYTEVGGWTDASAHDHEGIIAAFRAGDPDAARTAMTEHSLHAGELIARQLRSNLRYGASPSQVDEEEPGDRAHDAETTATA